MIQHDPPAPGEPDAAEVLEAQSTELLALHKELIKAYEKELAFFASLEKRDRQAKAKDDVRLKKIWWLEAELRRQQAETSRLRAELERTRGALHNLQKSPMGRIQRSYWKMRQGARR